MTCLYMWRFFKIIQTNPSLSAKKLHKLCSRNLIQELFSYNGRFVHSVQQALARVPFPGGFNSKGLDEAYSSANNLLLPLFHAKFLKHKWPTILSINILAEYVIMKLNSSRCYKGDTQIPSDVGRFVYCIWNSASFQYLRASKYLCFTS